MRKLVTIRKVSEVNPIEGADSIECLTVEGWKVVSQKGNFQPGETCAYFEIDSFLPKGSELWDDLVAKSSREYEGKTGHVLRTIKLRGQVSQGWCIPIPTMIKYFPAFEQKLNELMMTATVEEIRDTDFAETIGVVKYEAPVAAELAGQVKGTFPSFIKKTDQERCQNLAGEIFADLDAKYEVSVKLDGTSMTVYFDPEQIGGVCSRNLELNCLAIENDGNTMVKLGKPIIAFLKANFPQIALQGELMGPSIQGNREQLKEPTYFIFDMYNMAIGGYVGSELRSKIMTALKAAVGYVQHVPVLHESISLRELGITNTEELLAFAEGKSLKHDVREGVVFKRADGLFSFKAISNRFLLKQKD